MPDIYQLSDFQNDSLYRMANNEGAQLMVAIDTTGDDDPEVLERLTKMKSEAEDLIVLGLVEDKTKKFTEQIMAAQMKTGRGYSVYLITQIGFDMFHGPRKRKIN